MRDRTYAVVVGAVAGAGAVELLHQHWAGFLVNGTALALLVLLDAYRGAAR